MTVTGNRRDTVRIVDMVAVKHCEDALTDTYFYQSNQGGSPSLLLVMNMDEPRPQAMTQPTEDANGHTMESTPYFDANTYTLEDGEQAHIVLTVLPSDEYCTFDLELTLSDDDTETSQKINNNGKPFAVTPERGRDWQRAYVGGINCGTDRARRGFVPADDSWYVDQNSPGC